MKKITKLLFLSFSLLMVIGLNNSVHANNYQEETTVAVDLEKEMIYRAAYSDMEYTKFEHLYDLYTNKFGPQMAPNSSVFETRDIGGIKTAYSDYFSNCEWISRSGEISLSIYWKDYLFEGNDSANILMYKAGKAWSALLKRHVSAEEWDNTDSMEAQFHCHVMTIGSLKKPWNIEPWRTETDINVVISCGCNP